MPENNMSSDLDLKAVIETDFSANFSAGRIPRYEILDNLVLPVYVLGPDGTVLHWNRAIERMTGVLAHEVVGTATHWKAFYKAARYCLADFIVYGRQEEAEDVYFEAGPSSEQPGGLSARGWFVLPFTGANVFCMINACPVYDEHGQLMAVVQSFLDITAHRRIEMATETSIRRMPSEGRRTTDHFTDSSETHEAATERMNEQLWRQANYDALTKLPNRRLFRNLLDRRVHDANKNSKQIAILYIDLDNFKDVNDGFSHGAGDQVLIEAAQRLARSLRDIDVVAHLGADEFAVILTDIEGCNMEQLCNRILQNLAESYNLGSGEAYITAAIGISTYPADGATPHDLLKNADHAMQVAKAEGRNRFAYYKGTVKTATESRMRLLADLHTALALDQLQVHFQPIIEMATGRIEKAEALIRWRHPDLGWVSPAEFIPLAEKSGLIHSIGDWVFRESAKWSLRWSERIGRVFQISVNKSPIQFVPQGGAQPWPDYLASIGVPGSSIEVEITEGILLNAAPRVQDRLKEYRDAGMEVAIDDFGTGYSSLSYLKKFSVDYLKIDQSFVRDMSEDENDRAIAETIIVMAHKLGLKVIAEGIETEAQRQILAAAQCDYGQGWLFSKALPAEQFESLLLSDKVF